MLRELTVNLSRFIESLFPGGVVVEVGVIAEVLREAQGSEAKGGFSEEHAAMKNAGEKRLREFAAGRHLARSALARLGVDAGALPPRPDRTVPWPKGTVGSITHTDRHCAVAVTTTSTLASLGLDLEPAEPVSESVFKRITTMEERGGNFPFPEPLRGRILFSAKEALYKAQYPLTGEYIGFKAVALTFAAPDPERPDSAAFSLKWVDARGPSRLAVAGRVALQPDLVVSTAWTLPQPASTGT